MRVELLLATPPEFETDTERVGLPEKVATRAIGAIAQNLT